MIQAPQTQYIPQTATQVYNQPQGCQIPAQCLNQPGVFYNYPTASTYGYGADKTKFNGVNIEILNPQGVGSAPQAAVPFTMPAQYVPVQQTYQMPVQAPSVMQPAAPQAFQPAAPVNVETPQVPAPQIETQQQAPQAAIPTVEQSQAPDSSVTPESFASKLKTSDLEAQKAAIEEVAELVKNDDAKAPLLLDTQIFDSLVEIINKDTSQLEGPSPDVVELRNKPQEQLSEEEKAKALEPSELEKAEMNKLYALYTISYMQERLNNELEKRNGQTLELKDLPCIETVITNAKENKNPVLRMGALEALNYIAKPQYANDIKTICELAQSDEDDRVKETAANIIKSLPADANTQAPQDDAKAQEAPKEEAPKEEATKEEAPKDDKKAEEKK